tara:strand:+ start:1071 stop:1466 length:396 start_codon:yes stop_codon:yes gene_type:complete
MDEIDSATSKGRIGECLLTYLLEKCGVECHHVDRSGVDLWCQSRNKEVFTVQVKSANVSSDRPKYAFNVATTKTADFYVFVALDLEQVIVKPVSDVAHKTTLRIAIKEFNDVKTKEGLDLLSNFKREDHLP